MDTWKEKESNSPKLCATGSPYRQPSEEWFRGEVKGASLPAGLPSCDSGMHQLYAWEPLWETARLAPPPFPTERYPSIAPQGRSGLGVSSGFLHCQMFGLKLRACNLKALIGAGVCCGELYSIKHFILFTSLI